MFATQHGKLIRQIVRRTTTVAENHDHEVKEAKQATHKILVLVIVTWQMTDHFKLMEMEKMENSSTSSPCPWEYGEPSVKSWIKTDPIPGQRSHLSVESVRDSSNHSILEALKCSFCWMKHQAGVYNAHKFVPLKLIRTRKTQWTGLGKDSAPRSLPSILLHLLGFMSGQEESLDVPKRCIKNTRIFPYRA